MTTLLEPDLTLERELLGREVLVHWNTHRKAYSVLDARTRRVVAHREVFLLEGVRFVVQPGGRRRVLATGQRAVHAYARGTVADLCFERPDVEPYAGVRYDVRRDSSFVDVDTAAPIRSAPLAWFRRSYHAKERKHRPLVQLVRPAGHGEEIAAWATRTRGRSSPATT